MFKQLLLILSIAAPMCASQAPAQKIAPKLTGPQRAKAQAIMERYHPHLNWDRLKWSEAWYRLEYPLLYALHNGLPEMAMELVELDVDVNDATGEGWTPLMLALNHQKLAMRLIEKGADLHACDKSGGSVLDHLLTKNLRDKKPLIAALINAGLSFAGVDSFPNPFDIEETLPFIRKCQAAYDAKKAKSTSATTAAATK